MCSLQLLQALKLSLEHIVGEVLLGVGRNVKQCAKEKYGKENFLSYHINLF